jgi:hypothetical protein
LERKKIFWEVWRRFGKLWIGGFVGREGLGLDDVVGVRGFVEIACFVLFWKNYVYQFSIF